MATKSKRGLGRGLSALIPGADMDFLSSVARGDISPTAATPEADSAAVAVFGAPHDGATEPAAARSAEGGSGVSVTDQLPPDPLIAQLEDEATGATPSLPAPETEDAAATANVAWIKLSDVEANPYQPRRHFNPDELQDLVESIREHGVLQPILVRPNPTGGATRWQLVAGERRWRAAQTAGLDTLPAIIREVEDQQALELAIIENVQRHDISAVDTAIAYRRLAVEFKLSQEAIAARVGKSRSAVANTMRLLDLPEEVQKAIDDGQVSEGHGRAILMAPTDGSRRALFRKIVRDQLSVRETEKLAQNAAAVAETPAAPTGNRAFTEPELKDLEHKLTRVLGTRLQIKAKGERGALNIQYSSPEELERICDLLLSLKGA